MRRLLLTVFIASPVAVFAGLMWYWASRPASSLVGQSVVGGSTRAEPADREVQRRDVVLIVKDRSGLATDESPVYVASNAVGWRPDDPTMRMRHRADGLWELALSGPVDGPRLEFKLTRGSWAMVEVAADLKDVPNRTLAGSDEGRPGGGGNAEIRIAVEAWRDQRPGGFENARDNPTEPVKAVGRVDRLAVIGGGGSASAMERHLFIWVPPDYGRSGAAYPVLYLQDGQNLFESGRGSAREWEVDETATALIEEGRVVPLIIVGVPHAGEARTEEYCPVPYRQGWAAAGDEYVQFLVDVVMPAVESAYRVRRGPENTGIGGSSLGAVISLYAATQRPDLFGRVLVESPAMLVGREDLWEVLVSAAVWPRRVYAGVGSEESGSAALDTSYRQAAERLDALLAKREVERLLVVGEGHAHDERAWAARLATGLEFLFPPE